MQSSDKSPTKAKGMIESTMISSMDFLDQLRGKKPVPRSGAGGLWEEKGGPHEPSTPLKSSATSLPPPLPPSATYMVAEAIFLSLLAPPILLLIVPLNQFA